MKNKKNVICRPCAEKTSSWEIVLPNGEVAKKHYKSKSECMQAGSLLQEEYACDLIIQEENLKNNK
jgi:hypothetical protein